MSSLIKELPMERSVWPMCLFALWGVMGVAQAAGDVAAGKARAADCAECHGASGEGLEGPKVGGKPESELVKAMQDYKSGKRADAAMKEAMSKLSDQDIANLAAYYATLK
jgi:cytochrome c553